MAWNEDHWGIDVFIDYVHDQAGGGFKTTRNVWNIVNDYKVIVDSDLPQPMKDAALIIIIINELGNPLPTDIPLLFTTAYDLLYNTPDFVGGYSKEELWDWLHSLDPENFPQGGPGEALIPPDTLSNLENKPRTPVTLEGLDDNPPPPPR